MKENKNYTIGEVSRLLNVREHTIRFWEKEFPLLSPRKNEKGRRVYNFEDIKILQEIKKLLYQDGYTIKGALKELEREYQKVELSPSDVLAPQEREQKVRKVQNTNRDALMKKAGPFEGLYRRVNKEILFRIYNAIDELIQMWEELPDE